MISACKTQDNINFNIEFQNLADALVGLLSTAGIKTKAYHQNLPFFSLLAADRKFQVIEDLKFYYSLCSQQVLEGKSLRDSQTFTWRALKACGLTPGSDFLSRIFTGDIVEIYNSDQIQIFRNLEFFDFCSYTLEDLYCREWWKLFERKDSITKSLLNLVPEIFSGEHPQGVHYPVQKHTVKEAASSETFQVALDFKFIGPLFNNKLVKAILCIEQATFLSPDQGLA
jgi:hypothetical protein